MNLREKIHRHLIETHEVSQTRRYRWLSGIAVVLVLVSTLHVFDPEYRQVRRVSRHIAEVGPRWDAFKRANPGFDGIEFYPKIDSAWGVLFAARGKVPPGVNTMQLSDFMWSTAPPASVDVSRVFPDYSGVLRAPLTRKVSVLTTDGRRLEIEVPATASSGTGDAPEPAAFEPLGATDQTPPTRQATNR